MAIFHVQRQGNIGNQMIQYLVARALRLMVPDLVISNVSMPDWGIEEPEVPVRGRVVSFAEPNRVPLAAFRDLFAGGGLDCIRYAGYGQRIENFPDWREASGWFRRDDLAIEGFGPEHLVINVRTGEILDGRHRAYVLVPVEFYRDLVRLTGLAPVFMGQVGDDPYSRALREAFPRARFIPSGGAIHDFELLRRSTFVVPSVSTFAWLACWLSGRARTIFLPLTGLFNPMHWRDHDFAPTGDARFRFFLFPANYASDVAALALDHGPLRGRQREVEAADLARMKTRPDLRPRRIEEYLPHFDEAFYRRRYPDVRRAVESGLHSGLWHYAVSGFREHREVLPIDRHWYVRTYPEAADDIGAGRFEDEWHHFASVGARRGYRPVPP